MLASEATVTADPKGAVFLGLVGDVRALLARLGVAGVVVTDVAAGDAVHPLLPTPPWLHPGRRAALKVGGEVLALVGELAPAVARAFGLEGRTAVAEVNLARVLATGRRGSPYRPPARFPEAPFDVAVVVPRKTAASVVADVLRKSTPGVVRDVRLFDVYEGTGIPDGQRSLAFTVTFGDDDKTLESKTIEKLQGRAIEALRRAGYVVRTADAGPVATG
jgi:phenylalanyl-tRNA synthetase beta chain